MATRKSQRKAGAPEKPRGQETGEGGQVDQNRLAKAETPSLRGRRKKETEFFADKSAQHVGSDAATPRSNQPSVPATLPANTRVGEAGDERAFKQRRRRGGSAK
ncbi:MAG TPA: hypothetical protein VGB17_07755 [Pyrinomonadaceae bacterium]|jgi:hypothetical protein